MDAGTLAVNAGCVYVYRREIECSDTEYYADDNECPGMVTGWVQVRNRLAVANTFYSKERKS